MVYLSDRQVAERYGVFRTTVWGWARSDPTFPKPVALSPGCTRWKLADLVRWEESKAKAQAVA